MTADAIPASSSFKLPEIGKLNFILTTRGLLLLAFMLFLILGPVSQSSDIVASVFSYSLAGIVLALCAITVVSGTMLRRRFQHETLVLPGDSRGASASDVLSREEASIVLKTAPINILPFFFLEAEIRFIETDLSAPIFRLSGSSPEARILKGHMTFPHRGRWQLKDISCSYGDKMGLTLTRWQSKDLGGRECVVRPAPYTPTTTYPILSSSHRAGDAVTHLTERKGDPFDLKPYHPADGLKKILWKVYAKSGHLISRHPEPSMTPEGQVLIFILAGKNDDHVVSAARMYVERLEEIDLEVFAGCEGMRNEPPARNANEVEELLIESVWNISPAPSPQARNDMERFLTDCQKILRENTVQLVVIFCAKERFTTKDYLDEVVAIGAALSSANIAPCFFLAQNSTPSRRMRNEPARAAGSPQGIGAKIAGLFVDRALDTREADASFLPEFMNVCTRNSWEVIL